MGWITKGQTVYRKEVEEWGDTYKVRYINLRTFPSLSTPLEIFEGEEDWVSGLLVLRSARKLTQDKTRTEEEKGKRNGMKRNGE